MVKAKTGDAEKKEEDKPLIPWIRDRDLNIHQRINKIMEEIDYVKKDKKIVDNKGKPLYNVTGHDAVTKLIHPLLVKHGINIFPSMRKLTAEVLVFTQYEKIVEVPRERVDARFRWINIDDPKDCFFISWSGYGCDKSDKGPGKAISYIQRMMILKTFHLETGERDIEEYPEPGEEVIPHSKAVDNFIANTAAGDAGDIPLGQQVGAGQALADEMKDARISKGAATALERLIVKHDQDKKFILDQFQVDTIEELLINQYNAVKDLITG